MPNLHGGTGNYYFEISGQYEPPYNHFPFPTLISEPENITGVFTSTPVAEGIGPTFFYGQQDLPTVQENITDIDATAGTPIDIADFNTNDIEIPTIDPADVVSPLSPDTITTEIIAGTGLFDHFMRAIRNQLEREFTDQRIDGAEYSKQYTLAMEWVMGYAIQYSQIMIDGEIKAKLAAHQILEQKYKTAIAQYTAAKTEEDVQLSKQQRAELRLTGPVERLLKKMQAEETRQKTKTSKQEEVEMRANGATQRNLQREQTRKAEQDSVYTQESVREMRQKVKVLELQLSELAANGASERKLKASQVQVQENQASLYRRQARGFDDKQRADILKTVLDAWAIQVSEVDTTGGLVNALEVNNITETIEDAIHGVGLNN